MVLCILLPAVTTRDQYVFSFYPENKSCDGLENAVKRYREIVPHLKLSGIFELFKNGPVSFSLIVKINSVYSSLTGPTSFAPVIDAAINIVEQNNMQYHALVIIADGQVTRNPDVPLGRLSPQEEATMNSIMAAR